MKVEVAVIPAAGHGTRMHPATRSVPNALLPVVDRPAIQWVVEEGARAGVEEFIIVVNPGAEEFLFRHFDGTGALGELDVLEGLEHVRVRSVVQDSAQGLGDAVRTARDAVDGRPFFCLLADNIVPPGGDVLASLAAVSGGRSVMCLRRVEPEMLDQYGVAVVAGAATDDVVEVVGAVEKPGLARAPSDLGFVGRYLFTAEIFDHLDRVEPGHGGEIQLTDAIASLGAAGRAIGFVASRDLLDVGTPGGYLRATTLLALADSELGDAYREFLDEVGEC